MHGLGHPGVERTRQTISEKFFWPTMREDTSKWARECQHCQLAKINRHTTPPIGEFSVPERRFSHLNVDLVGPLPVSNGFRYLLTAVDRFTRWPIAIPMRDISAESVVDSFAHGWIAHFGVPASITTDRGSQFSSALWSQLMQTWSIKCHQTTAYHPAANGLVERFHRRLKESLIALSENEPVNWYWNLPCTLLCIRTTLKPDLGASPADLVYGEGLAVPGSLLPSRPDGVDAEQRQRTLEHLRLEVARLQPTSTSAHRTPRLHVPESLAQATHVFILRGGHQPSLTSPYMGPFRVISRDRDSYRVALPGRGTDSVNISRLKPAIVSTDEDEEGVPPVTPPSPPPPGRRPGVRTRLPETTDRVTRRQVRFEDIPVANPSTATVEEPLQPQPHHSRRIPSPASTPGPSTSSASNSVPSSSSASNSVPSTSSASISVPVDDNPVEDEPFLAPDPPQPPQPPQDPPAVRQQPRFFTRPNERQFSRQRAKSSYGNVLQAIMQRHLTVDDVNSSP